MVSSVSFFVLRHISEPSVSTLKKEEQRKRYKKDRIRPSRGRGVMSVDRLYPPSSPPIRAAASLKSSCRYNVTAMSISDLDAAVESGKFRMDDTKLMDYTPFCTVCVDHNQKTLRCQQVKNITFFIRNRNINFSWLQNGQYGSNKQRGGTNSYQLYLRNG